MCDEERRLEKLIRVFYRMQHSCLRCIFEKEGLAEISNPELLFHLRKMERHKHCTQRDMAGELGVAPPTVAISIKRMERAGLVNKDSNPDDLRKNCISLTEKGRALADQCMEAAAAVHCEVTGGFTEGEMVQMNEYLLRMIRNMERMGARLPETVRVKVGDGL